jgi:hypothetical protein
VLDFVGWLRAHNHGASAKVGFYGLDLYSLHASLELVIGYLDATDPGAAQRARERYRCFDHFGGDPQLYGYSMNNSKAMAIVGSRAVMLYYNQLRTAGAQVRKVLLANAAEKWGVSPASLRTEDGVVFGPSNQKLTYGEIASEVARYGAYIKNFDSTTAGNPKLSYAVVNNDADTDLTTLDKWYERDAGEVIGKYTLFTLKPRF